MTTTTTTRSALHDWDEPQTTSFEQRVRSFFAALLILGGMAAGGVVIYQISQFLFAAHAPALMERLSAASADELSILIAKGEQTERIQLPPRTLSIVGGFLALIALSIAGKLAGLALSMGARLLLPKAPDQSLMR